MPYSSGGHGVPGSVRLACQPIPTALHGSDDDSYPQAKEEEVENHLRADYEPSGFGASADVPEPDGRKDRDRKVQTIGP